MELVGLSKSYGGNIALREFSLSVPEDEYLTLLGPSGAGKSTLLRIIAGLEAADCGAILMAGEDVTYQLPHRRNVGFVQQKFGLFPHMSVFDNVAFGLRYREADPVTHEAEVSKRVLAMLDLVGLEDYKARMVGALSGGQRQRVSLARTLVCEPLVCLLDEPLGALDANLRERMTVELRRIRSALGVTFFHVTGNETEALAMGDRMVVLDQGMLVQTAAPGTVYARPECVRVAKMLSCFNILEGAQTGRDFSVCNAIVSVPGGIHGAKYCAVPYNAMTVTSDDGGLERPSEIAATFVTSEFLGSKIIYFFKTAAGELFEVERHLSEMPEEGFRVSEAYRLGWPPSAALFFDASGQLLTPQKTREAA